MEDSKRTAAKNLRDAAGLLEREGWRRGGFHDTQSGCRCAVGALTHAHDPLWGEWSEDLNHIPGVEELFRLIGGDYDDYDDPELSVIDWNDHSARDAEEVIATMRRVADELESTTP